jgi:hypothetical protein
MRTSGLLLLAALLPAAASCAEPLPARFVAQRVYLLPRTSAGTDLWFYVDSGGGTNMICRDSAERSKLAIEPYSDPESEAELGKNLGRSAWPAFVSGAAIPTGGDATENPTLLVHDCRPDDESPRAFGDAFLSSRWLAGHVWTWDYPQGTLRLENAGFRPDSAAQKIPIHFRMKDGKHRFEMIRMTVSMDGQPIQLLLDTGATTFLTPQAMATLHDDLPATRATSFIDDVIFNKWRKAHPDWRIIEHAEKVTGAAMIAVPDVAIADAHIGPVWFTRRDDVNFRVGMSAMTDAPIDGALGGDAFAHFVMTIDYPNAVAYFRCAKDCKTAKPK